MDNSDRIIDLHGLAPTQPEIAPVIWSGMTVIWRRAPSTFEPVRMPLMGVGVSYIGDRRSRSRRGFGEAVERMLEPDSVFVFADDDFYWEENAAPFAGVALGFDQTLLDRFAKRIEFGGPVNLRSAHFRRDDRLIAITKLMAAEIQSSGVGGKLYQDSLVLLAGLHLLREYGGAEGVAREPAAGLTSVKLTLIADYVSDHLGGDIGLEELARLVNMSPFHFARSFREATGRPPYRYVLDQRMARARELLTTTGLAVGEIAWRVGYANSSHFSAQFKRAFGVTPGRFRSRL